MYSSRIILVAALVLPRLAWADPAVGVWQTEPDRKNLVSHIEIRPCGPALCGRILRAFDRAGHQVTTPNIGKDLFWDVKPQGGGSYGGGTAWVPLLDLKAEASMKLHGDVLEVRGCKGPVCDGQVWRRLH